LSGRLEVIGQVLATGEANSKESSPFGGNLLVNTVEHEDEHSLQGSEDGEENQEDGDHNGLRDEEHKVSEHPGQTDGDINRDVDSEFLLSVSLIRLGSTGESLVDFTSNEEEENTIGRDDEKTRDEESHESGQIIRDPALGIPRSTTNRTILLSSSNSNNETKRKTP
jgi:hypothetical protein